MMRADAVMDRVAQKILDDGEFKSGDEVLVLVNGCGATTLMEMFILYNRLDKILAEKNITPCKPLIGNYVTTQEMAGFSLSMALADEEIKRLWSQPANTPFFKVMETPK
jgi:dihydroxyacetone kinase-like protein